MRTLQKNLVQRLGNDEVVQNLWCLFYSATIIAVYEYALVHLV